MWIDSLIVVAGISQTGSICRDALSATGFDVLGNSTKYATLLLSVLLWESPITSMSLMGVLVALTGGVVYSYRSNGPAT